MLGQGHRLDRQTKIAILSKKAQKFNDRFDELERTGVHLKAIPQIIAQEEKDSYQVNLDVLPFDESRKVIDVGSALSLGFEKTHTIPSEAKAMNETIHKKFQITKEKKLSKTQALQQGLPIEPDDELGIFINIKLCSKHFSDAHLKSKEQDRKMKERIYKDHLAEISGVDLFKIPNKSLYGHDFGLYIFFQKMNFCYVIFWKFVRV